MSVLDDGRDAQDIAHADHHPTELGNMLGGYDCSCGEPWLTSGCMNAPTRPVVLCGDDPTGAMRADDPRWPGNQVKPLPLPVRMADRVVDLVFCPACLRLRIHPGHWVSCR